MKFANDRTDADPEKAAGKILEIAQSVEPCPTRSRSVDSMWAYCHQRSLARSARYPRPTWNEAGGRRLTPMDRLFLAVIVTALMLLVFSSALLVDRSQSPVTLIERPEKAKDGRP